MSTEIEMRRIVPGKNVEFDLPLPTSPPVLVETTPTEVAVVPPPPPTPGTQPTPVESSPTEAVVVALPALLVPSLPDSEEVARLRRTRARVSFDLERARKEQAEASAAAAEASEFHRAALVDAVIAGTEEARGAADVHRERRVKALELENARLHEVEAATTALARLDRQIEEAVAAHLANEERRLKAHLEGEREDLEKEFVRTYDRLWLLASLQFGKPPGDAGQLLAGNEKLALRLAGASVVERVAKLRAELLRPHDQEVNREG